MIERAQARIREYEKAFGEQGRPEGEPRPQAPVTPIHQRPADEVAGEKTRRRIVEIRARLREFERWLRELRPEETDTIKRMKQTIAEKYKELDRERDYAEDLGQSTGEDEDEPILPPPPEPPPIMTVTYIEAMVGYWNRKTGEMRLFRLAHPPKSPDWEPVTLDPKTHKRNVEWGWVPVTDPETGKHKWIPGWVPAGRFRPVPGTDALMSNVWPKYIELRMLRGWSELVAAQKAGINSGDIARRFQIDWTAPIQDLTAGLSPDEMQSFSDRVEEAAVAVAQARRRNRGSSILAHPTQTDSELEGGSPRLA
jgi:hypothetical protein